MEHAAMHNISKSGNLVKYNIFIARLKPRNWYFHTRLPEVICQMEVTNFWHT